MSFYKQVGEPLGLSPAQVGRLEVELKELQDKFNQSNDSDNQNFEAAFYQDFETISQSYGIDENQMEVWVDCLYHSNDYQQLAMFVISSYYNMGGDRDVFEATYAQMLSSLRDEQN
ncbi:MAG: hypothetical protein EOO07_38820 [Chitinophagaceae bacterium]|nr:MAG: hypothetical protein EOO07_38820 [Chitinophagaceae bacterium]